MKVLYIVHSTNMGGATISFFNMILGLKEKGVIPIVVYPMQRRKNELFLSILLENNVRGYQVPLRCSILINTSITKKFLQLAALHIVTFISQIYLGRIIKTERPDIIHSNTGVLHIGNTIAHKYNIPHFWHIREYQDLDFHYKILPSKKEFCKILRTSYVITISKGLIDHFDLNNYNNALCIYNGIYKKTAADINLPKEKFFLSASRVSPEKGINDIIDAFAMIHDRIPEYKLIIAGSGQQNYIDELKRIAKEKSVSKHVKFIGHQDSIKELLKQAKALIVASYNEGFGRMTAEAYFMGCLVIGRNTAGTKEIMDIVSDNYRFDTTEELSRQMITITKIDDERYKDVVCASQKEAIESFSIENNVNRVFTCYKETLSTTN